MHLLPLIAIGLLAADRQIDDFQYPTVTTAREAWVAASGTPPVETVRDGGRVALRVTAPFATEPDLVRTVIDRNVRLDLAAAGEIVLDIACDRPEEAGPVTLYFRSGKGWYAGGGSLEKSGWQSLHFSKASFRTEESPTGWHRIDGIRIAMWRGPARDTSFRLGRLAALSHDVALVIPNRSAHAGDGELDTALDAADRLSGMLAELGLGADAIDDVAITQGALGHRKIAILAYNPRLTDAATAALQRFVTGGGKLLVCYQLPGRLADILGFANPKYIRPEQPGHFARIRFDAPDMAGLPDMVEQASWNITTAEPVDHNARVIGRWYDASGGATDRAAMLISDRGAFFSHIVLGDDRQRKKQMLAAVLGHLAPSLWKQMTDAAVERVATAGHCKDLPSLIAHVRTDGNARAMQQLDEAMDLYETAKKESARGAYPEAVRLARRSHERLAEAYLRAQPSPAREGRAVWNHSGTGAYSGDWDRSAKELAAAGFNMVLPNMLWGGQAHYPSDVLPRSGTFRKYGDQIEQCTTAAKKYGLEVHVWKVNYNLSGAPREFVDMLRRQGRTQVSAGGEHHPWLCPSHPENKRLELESMLEVAREYPVDGLHFDYIRYPGSDRCYCDGCRDRFEADSGRRVTDWPADCYSGDRSEAYNDWRCRQITDLVAAVHREGKRLRPTLKISAAVFGAYPDCRRSVAQDWPEWIRLGYLDFVCPMDYTTSDPYFKGLVKNQLKLVGGRIPIYPGIGATASNSTLTPDRVVGQIHHARSLGAQGFTIFNYHRGTATSIIPGVGLGAGAQRAKTPH
ncbi:MAG: family 10 glycosylhydrolase [Thermoguttaceae bacterium]